jgi:SAM-dependent methyltransferase
MHMPEHRLTKPYQDSRPGTPEGAAASTAAARPAEQPGTAHPTAASTGTAHPAAAHPAGGSAGTAHPGTAHPGTTHPGTAHPGTTHRHYLPGMGRHWLLPLYDPLTRLLGSRRAHRLLAEEADVQPGQRVLEIGCGTGNLLLRVKRLRPDAAGTGLDPDPRALARAARKARRAHLPVRLDQGFADRMPYPDGSFDRVLSAFMLHHLEPGDRVAALREVRRVLAPGGSLHLIDFSGGREQPHGFLGRRLHRNLRMRHNLDGAIPDLMREAGLTGVRETGQHHTRLGPYASYAAYR